MARSYASSWVRVCWNPSMHGLSSRASGFQHCPAGDHAGQAWSVETER
jgi:hypothetical protein